MSESISIVSKIPPPPRCLSRRAIIYSRLTSRFLRYGKVPISPPKTRYVARTGCVEPYSLRLFIDRGTSPCRSPRSAHQAMDFNLPSELPKKRAVDPSVLSIANGTNASASEAFALSLATPESTVSLSPSEKKCDVLDGKTLENEEKTFSHDIVEMSSMKADEASSPLLIRKNLNGQFAPTVVSQSHLSIRRCIQEEGAKLVSISTDEVEVKELRVKRSGSFLFIVAFHLVQTKKKHDIETMLCGNDWIATKLYLKQLHTGQKKRSKEDEEGTFRITYTTTSGANLSQSRGNIGSPKKSVKQRLDDKKSFTVFHRTASETSSINTNGKFIDNNSAKLWNKNKKPYSLRSGKAVSFRSKAKLPQQKPPWVSILDDSPAQPIEDNDSLQNHKIESKMDEVLGVPSPLPVSKVPPSPQLTPQLIPSPLTTPEERRTPPPSPVGRFSEPPEKPIPKVAFSSQLSGCSVNQGTVDLGAREHSFNRAVGDGFLLVDLYQNHTNELTDAKLLELITKGVDRQTAPVEQLEFFFAGGAATLTGMNMKAYVAEYLRVNPDDIVLFYQKEQVNNDTLGFDLGWENGSLIEAVQRVAPSVKRCSTSSNDMTPSPELSYPVPYLPISREVHLGNLMPVEADIPTQYPYAGIENSNILDGGYLQLEDPCPQPLFEAPNPSRR